VARSKIPLRPEARRKIALFCNVEESAVVTSTDMRTILESPLLLDQEGLGEYLVRRLALSKIMPEWSRWRRVVQSHISPENQVTIAICGKYAELADCYVSVNEALRDAGAAANAKVQLEFIETDGFETDEHEVKALSRFDGILVPGGFGSRGAEGKIKAIEYARMHDVPFLGICFGFQMAVVEYARSLGLTDAASSELNPETKNPVIDLMPEQSKVSDKGGTMRLGAHEISLDQESKAYSLYLRNPIWERHRHRYEVNPKYIQTLTARGLRFSGKSDFDRRMEILELPSNRYHFATQYHAEFKSRPGKPSPPYFGLIEAALSKKEYVRPTQVQTHIAGVNVE
jgi:CTP synthase